MLRVVGAEFYPIDAVGSNRHSICLLSGIERVVGVDISPGVGRKIDGPEDWVVEVNCSGEAAKSLHTVNLFLKLFRCRLS